MILKIMRPGYRNFPEGQVPVISGTVPLEEFTLAKTEYYEAKTIYHSGNFPENNKGLAEVTFTVRNSNPDGTDNDQFVSMRNEGERAFIMENGKTVDSVSI